MEFTSDSIGAPDALQDFSETSLPIFKVERVQLQFSISSDFVAAQVANNVLVLALSTGRILRIDLGSPGDIDGSSASHCFNRNQPKLPLLFRYRLAQEDFRGWPNTPHVP